MCLTPYRLRQRNSDIMEVPCQQCPECRAMISKHMGTRIKHECDKNGYTPYFITYTIAPEFYVMSPEEYTKYIVDMHKRIRNNHKIKYIYTIERGDRFGRLHAHSITLSKENLLKTYEIINDNYGIGFVQVKPSTAYRIHYVVSYIYDGVLKRAYSKGLGKLEEKELIQYFNETNYPEIPLYYRKKVKESYPEIFKEKLKNYLFSREYDRRKALTKDLDFIIKKLDKIDQIKYALDRYKIAQVKEDTKHDPGTVD